MMKDGELFVFNQDGITMVGSYASCRECQAGLYKQALPYSGRDYLGVVPSVDAQVEEGHLVNEQWVCAKCRNQEV